MKLIILVKLLNLNHHQAISKTALFLHLREHHVGVEPLDPIRVNVVVGIAILDFDACLVAANHV